MKRETPHSKYQHLYVVLRIDDLGPEAQIDERLSAVSAFVASDDAADEAERLNGLRPGGRSRYVVLTTRLKGQTDPDD